MNSSIVNCVLDREFWKHPIVVLMVGIFSYLLKSWYDRCRQRFNLLVALLSETETSLSAINGVLNDFPAYGEVTALLEAVESRSLEFNKLDKLQSGFCMYPPSISYGDLVTKLKPHESKAAIMYVDAWARFVDLERRYSVFFLKLVDLAPLVNKGDNEIQAREIATQVKDTLAQILQVLKELVVSRKYLEKTARIGTAWYGWKPSCLSARPERLSASALKCRKELKEWNPLTTDAMP